MLAIKMTQVAEKLADPRDGSIRQCDRLAQAGDNH